MIFRPLLFLVIAVFAFGKADSQVICIDPGHGYGPNGENLDGRTLEEITTNCAVGLLLRDTLEKQGFTVIMTRTTSDTGSWMSLTQRAELADNYDSDRLLSIHCNGGGGTGTETFWCYRNSPNRAIDSTFSLLTQQKMVYSGDWTNRRSIEDEIYLGFHLGVLKGATPGCLSEIGFVDRPSDLEKLLDNSWRIQFAIAYSDAINESFTIDYPSSLIEPAVKLNIYPNPFVGNVYVAGIGDKLVSVKLFDFSGREIAVPNCFPDTVEDTYIINLSALPIGIYQLAFITRSASYYQTILKVISN